MNTHEISAMIVLVADVLSYGILCFFIYHLGKKIQKLEEKMSNQSLELRISGKDLIGVLDRSKNKPSSQEMADMINAYKAKDTPPEFPQDRTGHTV